MAGWVGFGRLWLPGAPVGRQFIAGLALAAGVGAGLAWVAPLVVVPLFRAGIVLGWAVLLHAAWRRELRFDVSWGGGGRALLALVIGGAFALPTQVGFVSIGDNSYFLGQVPELFLADYWGPLRVAVAYPREMAACHLLGSTAVAALGALLPIATMLDALEIRFLLLAVVVARVSFVVLSGSARPLGLTLVLLAAGWLVFHQEIWVAQRESTFFYLVLACELGLILAFDRERTPDPARDALFILLAMVGAKASIFYLPGLVAGWVVLRTPRLALHPAILAGGLVTFVQLALTATRPKPFADVSIKLSLFNPSGGRAAFDYFGMMSDALTRPDGPIAALPALYTIGPLLLLAMIALKYWLVPIRAVGGLVTAERREILRIAEIFLLVMLLGLVLIRHDQHGVTHQIWVLYGTAPLVMCLVVARSLRADGSVVWPAGLVAAALLVAASGYSPWSAAVPWGQPHLGGLTLAELNRLDPADVLRPRPGDASTDPCERALLLGVRVAAEATGPACWGTLGTIVLEPRR